VITRRNATSVVWAGGIHLKARLEDEKQRILVLIGATPEGKMELVGFTDGAQESAADCCDILAELKRRGLAIAARTCHRRRRGRHLEGGGRGVTQGARAAAQGRGAQDRQCSPSAPSAGSL
jgi:hypothetical protein